MTSSTAFDHSPPTRLAGAAAAQRYRWPRTTRRGVQVSLGVLWLIDAALQLQPFMFTTGFARQVLAPTAQDQPGWVAGPVDFFARLVAAHPAALNTGFALVQLALGVGFLFPRLVRPAIVGSVAWSAGIWWFGEGLGGLASGHASLVTGAPGAVLLYAVLALAVWPQRDDRATFAAGFAVAGWFPFAWAVLWVGGAILQILPGQRGSAALADQVDSTDGAPGWLEPMHHNATAALSHGGNASFLALVAVMSMVGVAGLAGRRWQIAAAAVGSVVATAFWVLGQNVGELYSGQSTDPNTGPLIVVMALALASTANPNRRTGTAARPSHDTNPGPLGRPTTSNGNAIEDDGSENDMKKRKGPLALLIAVPLLLTGCAAASAGADETAPATSMAHTASLTPPMSMAPGMTMAPGQSMSGMAATTPAPTPHTNMKASSPSASATMICGPETVKNVTILMGMRTPAPARATWANRLYTCTYQLPGGPLALSVKESSDAAEARGYFDALRARIGRTAPVTGLAGLGLPAYEKTNGTVVFLKDNMTLQVDATALPPRVGPQNTTRADLAYTVATDILACWSGK